MVRPKYSQAQSSFKSTGCLIACSQDDQGEKKRRIRTASRSPSSSPAPSNPPRRSGRRGGSIRTGELRRASNQSEAAGGRSGRARAAPALRHSTARRRVVLASRRPPALAGRSAARLLRASPNRHFRSIRVGVTTRRAGRRPSITYAAHLVDPPSRPATPTYLLSAPSISGT